MEPLGMDQNANCLAVSCFQGRIVQYSYISIIGLKGFHLLMTLSDLQGMRVGELHLLQIGF